MSATPKSLLRTRLESLESRTACSANLMQADFTRLEVPVRVEADLALVKLDAPIRESGRSAVALTSLPTMTSDDAESAAGRPGRVNLTKWTVRLETADIAEEIGFQYGSRPTLAVH